MRPRLANQPLISGIFSLISNGTSCAAILPQTGSSRSGKRSSTVIVRFRRVHRRRGLNSTGPSDCLDWRCSFFATVTLTGRSVWKRSLIGLRKPSAEASRAMRREVAMALGSESTTNQGEASRAAHLGSSPNQARRQRASGPAGRAADHFLCMARFPNPEKSRHGKTEMVLDLLTTLASFPSEAILVLGTHLSNLLRDTERCETMGRNARNYIAQRYSMELQVRQIESMLLGGDSGIPIAGESGLTQLRSFD